MEPRPQRPRAQPGQHQQTGNSQAAPQPQAYPPGSYPEGADPTSFVAPPRTEYDYSPLDLAPPGQRRRRQLVAAVVGVLSVLLLGAIVFFSFLLLRDEEPPSEEDDLLAAQTEIAAQQATIDANQTVVAQAAAEQTAEAEALNPGATAPATEEAPAGEDATEDTPAGEDAPPAEEETPSADTGEEDTSDTSASSELAGQPSLTSEQLATLLTDQAAVPEILTIVNDSSLTEEEVAAAIGGNRQAETNLETWGWSGNAQRAFSPADPASVDPAATSSITVSIHGFGSPEGCAEALVFFSDILANGGYDELEAPPLGDSARLLTTTAAEDGTTIVALYVQDGSVLYRFGGASLEGDPTQDVIDVATATLGG
jgi:hypothetical protein